MQSITEKAMLARLQVTLWSARKVDKAITEEVRSNHGAAADAGRYNKALIGKGALQKVQQAHNAARECHYRYTLPWRTDGAGILSAKAYLQYTADMRVHKAAFDAAVTEFLGNYPAYVAEAKQRLNGMFKPEDYPSAERIGRKFSWQVTIEPLPAGEDFRVSLADDEISAIREQINADTQAALASGMQAAYKRVHDVLSAVVERLAQPDAIFRDSLIGNVQDLCSVLPLLNYNDSPELAKLTASIEQRIGSLDCETLRTSPVDRAKAAADAKQLLADMAGYMPADADAEAA